MIKHLVFYIVIFLSSLTASLNDKSAMVYYGENISYSMVGIHDYIIVQPELVNTYTHGFSLYKDKMYAYVSINEIHPTIKEFEYVKEEWIGAKNSAWNSYVLDIKNHEYQEFIFEHLIEPRRKDGFKHFFFDTLDSYHLIAKSKEEKLSSEQALADFINEFHRRYKDSKLIINRGFEIMDRVHGSIEAMLFESYYNGLSGNHLGYKKVSAPDREWLDIHLNKAKNYGVNIISVEYLPTELIDKSDKIIEKIIEKNMIPYVSNRELTIYGRSSKNGIKREVLTLINENHYERIYQPAHRNGATVLEYMGYTQKLYNINNGLPPIEKMGHYAGVIIWLQNYYNDPKKLIDWIVKLQTIGLKVAFANNFGIKMDDKNLKRLGLKIKTNKYYKKSIRYKDDMIGYEVEPPLSPIHYKIKTKNSKPLLIFELEGSKTSTPAAITPWGGYAIEELFIQEIKKENLWVVNPFEFFKEALRLKDIPVPDPSTENGKRLFFSHVDGDGIMNMVEGTKNTLSGDVILSDILKPYKVPHSISVIGAEIDPNGLFPKLSSRLIKISKDMYSLDNVEAATHTFTHPFFWGKIINDNLDKNYRLKVKDYNFSLYREIPQSINEINKDLVPPNRPKAKAVFWSGDCAPRKNALEMAYKNGILNINGGDTTITYSNPWLSRIAPLGLERDGYYQIYTGAQNENVYTNDWLGPFWGFKKVVQTFKLTNSPRRFKPIDIYYHLYSGSKMASLNALKYVFDWSLKQDIIPIYTSAYIPKANDFFHVSMANDGDRWLVDGMRDLKTLRIEKKDAAIDLKESKTVLGLKHFENHTYISLDPSQKHFVTLSDDGSYKDESYLISANGKVTEFINGKNTKRYKFDGEVDLKIDFHLTGGCSLQSNPKPYKKIKHKDGVELLFRNSKKAVVDLLCQ